MAVQLRKGGTESGLQGSGTPPDFPRVQVALPATDFASEKRGAKIEQSQDLLITHS